MENSVLKNVLNSLICKKSNLEILVSAASAPKEKFIVTSHVSLSLVHVVSK